MGITFYCQSCGVRFEVDPHLQGKRARCRKCGQRTKVPKVAELASLSVAPAVTPVVKKNTARPSNQIPERSWIANLDSSKVALQPLSSDRLTIVRPLRKKPDPLDDESDGAPYLLVKERRSKIPLVPTGRPA